jgi:tetratricopeptide (TPR) repeat protein
VIYLQLNRLDEAIQAFGRATALNPSLPQPYFNLATIFSRQGRFEEALGVLETYAGKDSATAAAMGLPAVVEELRAKMPKKPLSTTGTPGQRGQPGSTP